MLPIKKLELFGIILKVNPWFFNDSKIEIQSLKEICELSKSISTFSFVTTVDKFGVPISTCAFVVVSSKFVIAVCVCASWFALVPINVVSIFLIIFCVS